MHRCFCTNEDLLAMYRDKTVLLAPLDLPDSISRLLCLKTVLIAVLAFL